MLSETSLTDFEILRAKRDFNFFRRCIGRKTPRVHTQVIDKLMAPGTKNLLFEAHRGSGKTVLVSIDFPLWLLFSRTDKRLTIGVDSNSLEKSKLIIEEIQTIIRDYAWIREEIKPRFKMDDEAKWNATRITTRFGHRLFCGPFGTSARGYSFDYYIHDDVLRTDEGDPQIAIDKFWGDVFPTTRNFGRHLVVQTPLWFDDLVADIKRPERAELFDVISIPAFVDNDPARGVSIPELYSLEHFLMLKRSLPRHQWLREFELTPTTSQDMLFSPELLQKGHQSVADPEGPVENFGFLDVAYAGTDDSAICVVSKSETRKRVVYGEVRSHISPKEQMDWIASLNTTFRFAHFLVESNGVGQGLKMDIEANPLLSSFCEEFVTSRVNKEQIFGNLQVDLDSENTKLSENALLDRQLSMIGFKKDRSNVYRLEALRGHDDLAVACAGANFCAGSVHNQFFATFIPFDPAFSPFGAPIVEDIDTQLLRL